MKSLYLLTMIPFAISALAGCEKSTEKANSEPKKDATPDKTFTVNELVDKGTADEGAWKGKEVTVTGKISGISSDTLILVNDGKDSDKNAVTCVLKDLSKDKMNDTVKVKGTIIKITKDGANRVIALKPCEKK